MNTPHNAVPVPPRARLANLDALAGLAEDLNNTTLAAAGANLEDLIAQRFGSKARTSDVMDAMQDMRRLADAFDGSSDTDTEMSPSEHFKTLIGD